VDNLTGRQLRTEADATIFTSDHQKTSIGDADDEAIHTDNGVVTTDDQPSMDSSNVLNKRESLQPRIGKRCHSTSVTIDRPLSVPAVVGWHCAIDARLSADVRYDGINHHLDSLPTQCCCAACRMKTVKVCTVVECHFMALLWCIPH